MFNSFIVLCYKHKVHNKVELDVFVRRTLLQPGLKAEKVRREMIEKKNG